MKAAVELIYQEGMEVEQRGWEVEHPREEQYLAVEGGLLPGNLLMFCQRIIENQVQNFKVFRNNAPGKATESEAGLVEPSSPQPSG